MSFGDRLKLLREEAGISQSLLADKIGISKSSISKYEKGERTPELETFDDLADFFNVDMDYLMGKSDIRRSYNMIDDKSFNYPKAINKLITSRNRSVMELLVKLSLKTPDEIEMLNNMIK